MSLELGTKVFEGFNAFRVDSNTYQNKVELGHIQCCKLGQNLKGKLYCYYWHSYVICIDMLVLAVRDTKLWRKNCAENFWVPQCRCNCFCIDSTDFLKFRILGLIPRLTGRTKSKDPKLMSALIETLWMWAESN